MLKSIIASAVVAGAVLLASSAVADNFPVTFKHVYGETTIPSEPKRIVSLSYGRSDTLWALGIKPVGVRFWYGDDEYGVWPWARETFESFGSNYQPEVFPRGDLDIEKVAALKPDLILALWSGIKQEEYEILSKIAPVIAHDPQYNAYGTPWDVMTLTVGKAVGKYDQAKAAVKGINDKITKIAADHPKWQGKTSSVAFYWKDQPGAYTQTDIRARLINQMGFITNPNITAKAKPDGFTVSFSKEDMTPLESDVLFWVISNQKSLDNIKDLKMRKAMQTHKEGREVLVDELLTGAFSHATILSLPYALDSLVPLIEAAVDGDPNTVVQSSKDGGLLD